MTPHLTEAQIFDLLSATPDAAAHAPQAPAQAHLADCARCQDEFTTLEQSLANFRLAATQLSLLHTPPRPVVGATIDRNVFALPKLIWATGLASVLAVTALTLSAVHKPAPVPPHVAAVTAPQPVSDEALLQDIDSDLSTSVPPSLQPLDTSTTASESTTTSTSN
jgi:hypothetical protein